MLTGSGDCVHPRGHFFREHCRRVFVEQDMTGWLALGGVLLAGFAFLSLMIAFVVLAVKSVFWLILLPFRLLFWVVGAVVMLIGSAIGVVLALTVGLALILAPLLPLLIVGALVYGLVRLVKSPATV